MFFNNNKNVFLNNSSVRFLFDMCFQMGFIGLDI